MKRYLLTAIAIAAMCMPAAAAGPDSAAVTAAPQSGPKAEASSFKFSATFDMQVQKNLYDEYGPGSSTRFGTDVNANNYQKAADDFWMRIALKGSYRLQYLEGVCNLRFYPYWTLRRNFVADAKISGAGSPDVAPYVDVWELNQAYIKVFKEYSPRKELAFGPSFKIGRDGLLNSCSELFGNYLDQPTAGYGDDRQVNIAGPFLNKKIFANQMEAGFVFNAYDMVGGRTSLMIGGNVNNDKYYSAPTPRIYQLLDSKLSAGFVRAYQDLYFLNKRFHIGGGYRNYTTTWDSASSVLAKSHYFSAQGAFDAVIMPDVKFYTEIAVQKLGSASSTGIVRPINAGITIPTFGVVDTLAVEFENVAKTFFSDKSMRDDVGGRGATRALGWGIVLQKKYIDKVGIAWGLFTGNAYGDMQTVLRMTFYF